MEAQLAALRDFTGSSVSDAKLRSYLVRAAGDVDRAAGLVLSEGVLAPTAPRPPTSSARAPAPSALPTARSTKESSVSNPPPPQRDVVRRAAWNAFYKSKYKIAVEALGTATSPASGGGTLRGSADPAMRARITSYITDLWRDLGAEKRNELYARVRDEMMQQAHVKDTGTASVTPSDSVKRTSDRKRPPSPGSTRGATSAEVKGHEEIDTKLAVSGSQSPRLHPKACDGDSDSTSTSKVARHSGDIDLSTAKRSLRKEIDAVAVEHAALSSEVPAGAAACVLDARKCGVVQNRGVAGDDGSFRVSAPHRVVQRRGSSVPNFADDAGSQCGPDDAVVALERKDQAEWPKQIASRTFQCSMFVTGRNVLRAGQVVDLEPSQNIVRFCVDEREMGRLPVDAARVLSPALSSGHVVGTARVIEAPKVSRLLSPAYLEVNLFIRKTAFAQGIQATSGKDATPRDGESLRSAVRRRSKRQIGPAKLKARLSEETEGLDVGRLAVANMLASLNLCEPTGNCEALDVDDERSLSSGVFPSGPEVYYNAVQKIEGNLSDYSHPAQLCCELREYQKHGVCWMRAREIYGSTREGVTDAMLHPLWKRKEFLDGKHFYVNAATGGLSLVPPLASSDGPFGGILADEMGLGKTVECIAMMVLDRNELDDDLLKKFGSSSPGRRAQEVGTDDCRKKNECEATVDLSANSDDDSHDHGGNEDALRQIASEIGGTAAVAQSRRSNRGANCSSKVGGGIEYCEEVGRCSQGSSFECVEPEKTSRGSDRGSEHSESDLDGKGSVCDEKWSAESEESSDDSDFEPTASRPRRMTASRAEKQCKRGATRVESAETRTEIGWARKPRLRTTQSKLLRIYGLRAKESFGKSSKLQGGTLLVVPMSMMGQWIAELKRHVEPGFFRVTTHHERRCRARELSLHETDVVVTTYGVVASESLECDAGSKNMKELGPLFELEWRRVILDEAHTIKGRVTKNAKACLQLSAQLRWCVTGSPIQNHINDVQPLLQFIGVDPWGSWGFWQRAILSKIESADPKLKAEAMSSLRDILSPLTLRRLKTTLGSDGKPLVHLVSRKEEIVKLEPGPAEKDFYETLHKKSRAKFDTFLAQGKVMNKWGSVLELLLRLRQACCHPWLVFAASQADAALMKDRRKLYECFAVNGSKAYAEKALDENDVETSSCPICLCTMEDATAVKKCGHAACRNCLMRLISTRGREAACPICRVHVDGKTDLVTLPRHGGSRFPMDIKANWQSSAKLDAILKDVRHMEASRTTSETGAVGKTVVMSQFTAFLDLVGTLLERERVKFLRFDGTLPSKKRTEVLRAFAHDPEGNPCTANVLLVSLRSGSVGLNLCSASLLLLMDPSWNPAQDAQAAARVHRHGQTRPVTIKRYVIENSVEERLLEVQDRKLDMTEGALSVASEEDKKDRIERLKLLFSR